MATNVEYSELMEGDLEGLLRLYREAQGRDRDDLIRVVEQRFAVERTILVGDMAGFTRRVAADGIVHFLSLIFELRELCRPIVDHHGGYLFKADADNVFAVFPEPAQALGCAVAVQRALATLNAGRAPRDRIEICLGLARGRVLAVGRTEVWGQAVNLASKLGEDLARAGDILVHESLRPAADELGLRHQPCQGEVSDVCLCYDRLEAP